MGYGSDCIRFECRVETPNASDAPVGLDRGPEIPGLGARQNGPDIDSLPPGGVRNVSNGGDECVHGGIVSAAGRAGQTKLALTVKWSHILATRVSSR